MELEKKTNKGKNELLENFENDVGWRWVIFIYSKAN